VINVRVIDGKNSVMAWLNKDGSTGKILPVPFQASQNKLMLSVRRSDISTTGKLAFDFHWADNIARIGDITEFFMNGDNAPERRANYRFQVTK
jgi:hypothetical protein